MTKKILKKIGMPMALIVWLSACGGCALLRQSMAVMRSTEHFLTYENDDRVLFEPGAEAYAEKIAAILDSSVRQIESVQCGRFNRPVRVYICRSGETLKKYLGIDARAGVLTKLFLSPRIFEKGDEIAEDYLIHELSHLHIRDRIGTYRMAGLPVWFREGLATYASGGGGADRVTDKSAIDAIRSGRHFIPNERGGLIFPKTASDWGLPPHMFYRQSMLFVQYFAETGKTGFCRLIAAVNNGEPFSAAFEAAYHRPLAAVWEDFIGSLDNRSASRPDIRPEGA